MPKDLRSFLQELEEANEIIRIKKPVDPTQNLGGLAWQGENKLGKATFFENLVGYEGWNAVSYADASRKRLSLALGTTPKEFIPHLRGLLKKGPTPKNVVQTGPVKDVIKVGDQVNLYDLPIHQMSNMDGGRYIGGGIGIVKDPDTGVQNASLHRHQLKAKNKFGILMHPKRHMDLIYKKYEAKNEPMPMAIALGHHAALMLATCWTFPMEVDEMEMAGTFLGEPLRMVKCETQDLLVPADAEIVIEGYCPPFEREEEGPFAEHTGYARAGSGMNPYMIITAITMRKDAIFYALQGGKPIASSQILDAMPMEVVLWERVKDVSGYIDIKDVVAIPSAGGCHIIVVQITPKIQGEAREVANAVLTSPYIHPKIAIVVDDDVDPHDLNEVMWSVSTRVNPEKDVFIIPGMRGHHLDAAATLLTQPGIAPQIRRTGKMGIDATKPALTEPDARSHFTRSIALGADKYNIEDFLE